MKIDIVSDIHVTHYRDHGDRFFGELVPETGASTLIIAGDVGEFHWWKANKNLIEVACGNYENVLFIGGNHDYYGTTLENGDRRFREIEAQIGNFHFLEQDVLELDGIKIAGCTLWFQEDQKSARYEKFMNDFQVIQEFKPAVYDRNRESQDFLKQLVDVDVMVTHHMISRFSIHERYNNDPCNRYFLCDLTELILDRQPKFWIHGHTHVPFDYYLGKTRVICNPLGYPGERRFGKEGYKPTTIEV